MTKTLWRYSHLTLAISSFLFLLLAALTGIILSVEPITQKAKIYGVHNLDEVTVADLLPKLKAKYDEVTTISVESNRFVQIQAIDKSGDDVKAYIDPRTGNVLGVVGKKNEFFQWITTFHRSLFLHETGRFFIGLTAFLLMLIAISGIMLTIQRQRGFRRFFSKIHKDGFSQYYHVVLGRILLIPIFIIAISGTYLSLNTLGILKTVKESVDVNLDLIKSAPEKKIQDFAAFKNIKLVEVESIEFPFSEDVEDYFILKLKDRELAVNQITGDVLAESKYPFNILLTNLSLDLHTGRTNILWAIVLGISCIGILFFIYSGFAITLKRISIRTKNKYRSAECKYIILVGSENGSTYAYASAIHKLLLKSGEKSYLTALNNYGIFEQAEQLIILTSTYGLGEAPVNASRFIKLVAEYPQKQNILYSVLGFGSRAYPDFCKFAFDIHNSLSKQSWIKPLIDIHTVNDKSPQDLQLWAESWAQQSEIKLTGFPELKIIKPTLLKRFIVQSNSGTNTEGTFQLKINSSGKLKAKSGDLLAIYPANDHRERLYSIGIVDNAIQLSVRLHHDGLGSGYLNNLKAKDLLQAKVLKNPHFYFPNKASKVIMISNGTGIAPFLGMIDQNVEHTPCFLFCGFRNKLSYDLYNDFLNDQLSKSKVSQVNVAYSRVVNKQYVSDLISLEAEFISKSLMDAAVIMICGSLSMQKDIVKILEEVCLTKTGHPLSFYQSRNQVLTDCY
ncbi:FAD-binding oxidoreductase [Pedobacter frigidisoli]|uniref:FAD-binding oxidoreductase n=1 Tax=Pedobacter frigidisoli TaxID=2530455 RepID=A0A4R0NYP4_9SPHI|nr:PepSY domain-containing protein [Pedobacter frigidisoli]TCD05599.1 FAD-binding oxidoreductase [Pedobacter frigidisoli]